MSWEKNSFNNFNFEDSNLKNITKTNIAEDAEETQKKKRIEQLENEVVLLYDIINNLNQPEKKYTKSHSIDLFHLGKKN